MSDMMKLIPLKDLVRHIVNEFKAEQQIFGIPEIHFYRKKGEQHFSAFGESSVTPLGPAAGPHTQMAQNIAASFLTGGRFVELKTVQILDRLEIAKPCIDARDHAFNTEWSTELTLEQSWKEYAKAWLLCTLLDAVLGVKHQGERSFIFNMSVGYDLKGIQSAPMQTFIDGLIQAGSHPGWQELLAEWQEILADEALWAVNGWQEARETLLSRTISPRICTSVTLSTMHGCPPEEIEAIARYMLEEKGLHTLVKLNPTLLGYEKVREILDQTGFTDVELSREAFSHDLQYPDAVAMVKRLQALGLEKDLFFGVKLSNTLGNLNPGDVLPGDERYMSGRSLLPLTLHVAALLSREFQGNLPISYCGGASQLTIKNLLETGIAPVTVATDLLKPGGYKRMTVMAELAEDLSRWGFMPLRVEAIEKLAEDSLRWEHSQRSWRGGAEIALGENLPLFDCAAAPCRWACPIHQDIPEYLRLVGEGQYDEALDLIWSRNPLPSITGWICDHQCMANCTRLDYEGPVLIRDMKKIAAQRGHLNLPRVERRRETAVVIGAGPAGLASAAFLARLGFHVTVKEKERDAGGVIRHILPAFRIPAEALDADIKAIQQLGVIFHFGVDEKFTLQQLKEKGCAVVVITPGAEVDNILPLKGSGRVIPSLEFLGSIHKKKVPDVGRTVAVVGGGNTAMDSARSALRLPGVEKVLLFYRRSEAQMPADREEYENAKAEGVEFHFLHQPEAFGEEGRLSVRLMELGAADSSGRPRPEATDEVREFSVDTLVTAIGEKPDGEALKAAGVPVNEKGWPQADPQTGATALEGVYLAGDALTGPATVVEAMAGARRMAEDVASRRGLKLDEAPLPAMTEMDELEVRKGHIQTSLPLEDLTEFAHEEAQRCLECSRVCSKCVEVCPNRANVALDVSSLREASGRKLFDNQYQIIHIDAYCNECGNCTAFCPWDGRPFADKLTFYHSQEDFQEASDRTGFVREGKPRHYRLRLSRQEYRVAPDPQGKLTLEGGEGPGDSEMTPLLERTLAVMALFEERAFYFYENLEEQPAPREVE